MMMNLNHQNFESEPKVEASYHCRLPFGVLSQQFRSPADFCLQNRLTNISFFLLNCLLLFSPLVIDATGKGIDDLGDYEGEAPHTPVQGTSRLRQGHVYCSALSPRPSARLHTFGMAVWI